LGKKESFVFKICGIAVKGSVFWVILISGAKGVGRATEGA
jgi:hypothetical protein